MATAYRQPSLPLMNTLLSSKLRPFFSLFSSSPLLSHSLSVAGPWRRSVAFSALPGTRVNAIDAALMKDNWLDSLSLSSPDDEATRENTGSNWVIGIDPDLSGAMSVLKYDDMGCSAQVYDTPHLPVLVGKRVRKRLDAKSIVQLIRSLNIPSGSRAYIEQSIPFPKDGKQGWYSGGFGYGLWIGTLVASGFSVVPIPSSIWKKHFHLAGGSCTKDDSRRVASELFPLLASQLSRKKDHGRAEALLIAAYGEAIKLEKLNQQELVPLVSV